MFEQPSWVLPEPSLFSALLTDRPTSPIGPVVFEEVHREYMVISWKPPLDSGGVDVSNYIVEKRDTNRDMWTTVTSATTKTTCKVTLTYVDGAILLLKYIPSGSERLTLVSFRSPS